MLIVQSNFCDSDRAISVSNNIHGSVYFSNINSNNIIIQNNEQYFSLNAVSTIIIIKDSKLPIIICVDALLEISVVLNRIIRNIAITQILNNEMISKLIPDKTILYENMINNTSFQCRISFNPIINMTNVYVNITGDDIFYNNNSPIIVQPNMTIISLSSQSGTDSSYNACKTWDYGYNIRIKNLTINSNECYDIDLLDDTYNILISFHQTLEICIIYGCGSNSTTIIFVSSDSTDMFNTYQASESKVFSLSLSHVTLSDNIVSSSIIFHGGNYDDIKFQNIVLNQECISLNWWSLYMQSNNGYNDNICSNLFENIDLESSAVASYYPFIGLENSCKVIIENSTFHNNTELSLFECLNAARTSFATEGQNNIKLSNSTFYLDNDGQHMHSDTYGNITFCDNSFYFDATMYDKTMIPTLILLMPTNESSVDPTSLPYQ